MEHTDHSAYTVAIANTKGGVGKTTTTANLAALCADLGQRVLMIDCDKQGSLSKYFGLQTRAPNGLSYALTRRRIDGTCISSTSIERLDLIRHDDAMTATLVELATNFNAAFALERAIQQLRESDVYDLVFIDTPGSEGLLQDIGIVPADLIVSPVVPETLVVREVEPLIKMLRRYEDGMPNSRQSAVLCRPIIYKATNTTNSRQLSTELRSLFLTTRGRFHVCNTVIPQSAVFDKATAAYVPVHHIEPRKAGELGPISSAFYALVGELLPHLYARVNDELQSDQDEGTGT